MSTATVTKPPHPAKYSDALIPLFWEIVEQYRVHSILDPMAGVGKIGLLRDYGFAGRIVANEIEPEWAYQAPPWVEVRISDAANMAWARDGEFDAVITSPVYGNRMSDHFNARDNSRRYTYRHMLGRPLHPKNTGRLQWGQAYRDAHTRIWTECIRVLAPGGIMVVNCKNHIRRGEIVRVSEWHAEELQRQGLRFLDKITIQTPGMRHGANAGLRVEHEDVWVFRKPINGG